MIPTAWMRRVRSPSTPDSYGEIDYDLCYGDDQPEGEGWIPLYCEPPGIRGVEDGKERSHTEPPPPEITSLRLRLGRAEKALESIAGFGNVNLAGEWEHGLRDIIRSCVDCARSALPDERQPRISDH